ncbi:MAG: cupin domain-containing protein, partial [Ilumatobacter sp.]|uniref:JmjC domain-containing protein n=1 Tax=Ilumatobacter sp. TaxID=1967498 RepID=UPI003297ABBE
RRRLIRLVDDGRPIAPDRYTCVRRLGGADFDDVIDAGRVAELFAGGATVVAQSLHRTLDSTARFVALLSDEVSHPVQANAYLTPPRSQGLAPHVDRHDVFVVQLHGTKSWTVDGMGEIELRDGDVLYLPADTRHSAASTDETSLHLTIGILRVTYRSVVQRLLRDGPAALDDPLPLLYRDDAALGDAIGHRLDDLLVHLGSLDAHVVAARERSRPRQDLSVGGGLRRAVDVVSIDGTETIVRGRAEWSISSLEDGRIRVDDGAHHLDAPSSCEPAIRQLATGRPHSVSDLDGLDPASRVIIARRFLEVRLCEFAAPTDDGQRPT